MMKKVQILLSVYLPNKDYLKQQLESINQQTYKNLEVLIFDDGASIQACDPKIFASILTKVPFRILPYEKKNLGYVQAFEKLIAESNAAYLAFCDQDDIWHANKISKSIETLEKDSSLLAASNRRIINENNEVLCENVQKTSHKNYENWHTGDDICKYDLFICFAPGMSIVVNGPFARKCLPISRYTGHDKWLLACASAEGKVSYIEEPLVDYRRHGHNVSGVLVGIHSKEDYYHKRIENREGLIRDFLNKYPNYKDKKDVELFLKGQKEHKIRWLWKYRELAPDIAKFEMAVSLVPDRLFPYFVKIVQKISNI